MNTEIEIWKDIPNYEGCYMASSLGRIKSLKGRNELILKPCIHKGYKHVSLCLKGKSKTISVHSLVAISFLNHIPDGYNAVVDHIDNDKLNNAVNNLQIISQRENSTKDLFRKNHKSKYIGVSFHNGKKRWFGYIVIEGKGYILGYVKSEQCASNLYLKALQNWNNNKLKPIIKKPKYYSYNKSINKYKCYDIIKGKLKHMGVFKTEQEAIDFVKTYKL